MVCAAHHSRRPREPDPTIHTSAAVSFRAQLLDGPGGGDAAAAAHSLGGEVAFLFQLTEGCPHHAGGNIAFSGQADNARQ